MEDRALIYALGEIITTVDKMRGTRPPTRHTLRCCRNYCKDVALLSAFHTVTF